MPNRYRFRCKPVSRTNFRCCDNINSMLFLYKSVVLSLIERVRLFAIWHSMHSYLIVIYLYLYLYTSLKTRIYKLFFLYIILYTWNNWFLSEDEARRTIIRNYCVQVQIRKGLIICGAILLIYVKAFNAAWSLWALSSPYTNAATVAFVCPAGCQAPRGAKAFHVLGRQDYASTWWRLIDRTSDKERSKMRSVKRDDTDFRTVVVVDVRSSLQVPSSKATFYDRSYNVN